MSKVSYQAYKEFCERANIEGVYLKTNLSEHEIVEWEIAMDLVYKQ